MSERSDPVTPDHDSVISVYQDSITIGSDDAGHVFLPPEEAPIQNARIVHILATDELENELYSGGYLGDGWGEIHRDIIICHRWELALCGCGADCYAYSILFGDHVNPNYIGDIKRHVRLDRCPVNTTATR